MEDGRQVKEQIKECLGFRKGGEGVEERPLGAVVTSGCYAAHLD